MADIYSSFINYIHLTTDEEFCSMGEILVIEGMAEKTNESGNIIDPGKLKISNKSSQ